MADDMKRTETKAGLAEPDWAVAASILGLTRVLADFPADVEIGFRRAQGLRALLSPRTPGAEEGQKP